MNVAAAMPDSFYYSYGLHWWRWQWRWRWRWRWRLSPLRYSHMKAVRAGDPGAIGLECCTDTPTSRRHHHHHPHPHHSTPPKVSPPKTSVLTLLSVGLLSMMWYETQCFFCCRRWYATFWGFLFWEYPFWGSPLMGVSFLGSLFVLFLRLLLGSFFGVIFKVHF